MGGRIRTRKLVLLALAAMTLLFGVLTGISRTQKGVLFKDTLLKVSAAEGRTVYTGKAHGETVTITVTSDGGAVTTVEYVIGALFHDICTMEYPLAPVQTDQGPVAGVRITKNGELLFEGGCDPAYHSNVYDCMLYTPEGEIAFDVIADVQFVFNDDVWGSYTTSAVSIVRFAAGPELMARGSWEIYAMTIVLVLLAMVLTAFPEQLFQWSHRWYVKNPEPTELYFMMNWLSVAVLSAAALIFFNIALREIC